MEEKVSRMLGLLSQALGFHGCMRAMSLVVGVDVFVLRNGIENHIHDCPAGETPLERHHHCKGTAPELVRIVSERLFTNHLLRVTTEFPYLIPTPCQLDEMTWTAQTSEYDKGRSSMTSTKWPRRTYFSSKCSRFMTVTEVKVRSRSIKLLKR